MSHINKNILKKTTIQLSQNNTRRIQTKFFKKKTKYTKKNTKKKKADQLAVALPPQLISNDFLVLAQKKNNIIEQIAQERAQLIGKKNTYEDLQEQNFTIDNKKSSTLKKSIEASSSMKSKDFSKLNLKTELKQNKEDQNQQIQEKDEIIILKETETKILFENQSFWRQCQKQEDLELIEKEIQQFNKKKKELINSDNYVNHSTQTFMQTQKNQETQTIEKDTKEQGIQIYNFQLQEEIKKPIIPNSKQELNSIHQNIDSQIKNIMENPFTVLQHDGSSIKYDIQKQKKQKNQQKSKILNDKNNTFRNENLNSYSINTNNVLHANDLQSNNKIRNTQKSVSQLKTSQNIQSLNSTKYIDNEIKKFQETLEGKNQQQIMFNAEKQAYQSENLESQVELMEKVLNIKNNMPKYLEYRNFPNTQKSVQSGNKMINQLRINKDKQQKQKEVNNHLVQLFTYEFQFSENLTVNQMDFNSYNKDLFVSGYGNSEYRNTKEKGLIAIWSLKNTQYPAQFIETEQPCTSVKFSKQNPNLFACGFLDGGVTVYDTRQKLNQYLVQSKELNDVVHFDAIWNLDWVQKNQNGNKLETIVSISSDGKLFEWNLKKSLEVQELKIITQMQQQNQKQDLIQNNVNFRYTGGFGFDFSKKDPNIYFICTEDGFIHRCSKSYKERYLDTYYGHKGPIYKVRCNPFDSDILLTGSADWTCKIWSAKKEKFLFSLKNLDLMDEVCDVQWNPFCSTSFASVCKDGRLELWNLAKKNFDPIYCLYSKDKISKNCLIYSQTDPILMTGDVKGKIEVFRFLGYEKNFVDQEYEKKQLYKTLDFNTQSKDQNQNNQIQIKILFLYQYNYSSMFKFNSRFIWISLRCRLFIRIIKW